MTKNYTFQSSLAPVIERYIAEKRAVGYKYEAGAKHLKQLDTFLDGFIIEENALSKETVLAWSALKPGETIGNQCTRISTIRGLAEYMNRIGLSAYAFPKAFVTTERYAYAPYIFQVDEMRRIFQVADAMAPDPTSIYRHITASLLIRILYCCGLRQSEARNLKLTDVDLNKGTLFIRETKFNKERLLPVSDNLLIRCQSYAEVVPLGVRGNTYFFPSPMGGNYSANAVYELFRDLIKMAGISHLGRGKGPRLHDLRHTFAVHCLKKWVLEGLDLNNCLPYLSAYLGHEDLRGSQRYLRLTADLYPDILSKVEQYCGKIIPGGDAYETN